MEKDLVQLIGESLGISPQILENYKQLLQPKTVLALPPTLRETTEKEINRIVQAYSALKTEIDPKKAEEIGIYKPQDISMITQNLEQFRTVAFPHIYHKAVAQLLDQKVEEDIIEYLGRRRLHLHPEFASSENQEQVINTLGKHYLQEYLAEKGEDGRLNRVLDAYLAFARIPLDFEKLGELGIYNDRDLFQIWNELKGIDRIKHPVSYQKRFSDLLNQVTSDVALDIGIKLRRLDGELEYRRFGESIYTELTKMSGINVLVERIKANAEQVKKVLPMQPPQQRARIDLNDLHTRPHPQEKGAHDNGQLDGLFPPSNPKKDPFPGRHESPPSKENLPFRESKGGIILPQGGSSDFGKLAEELAAKRKKILGF